MIESILYEGTVVLGTGIDFRKGLGGNCQPCNCNYITYFPKCKAVT